MESKAYECRRCNGPMVADTSGPKHVYVCKDEVCAARAVIVPRGTNGEYRYDLDPVKPFPQRGGAPPPKDAASFVQSVGMGEATSEGPVRTLVAFAGNVLGVPLFNEQGEREDPRAIAAAILKGKK